MKRLEHWFVRDSWAVGIVRAPIHRFLDPSFVPNIEVIRHPKHSSYLADPFGTVIDGKPVILCEEYDHLKEKGWISQIDESGKITPVSLPLKCHLSYPYLFQRDGEQFLVAESWNAKKVQLFRWEHNQWTDYATLLEGVGAIDNTVFFHNGYWWHFYTDANRLSNANLFARYATDLKGPWTSHALNPIKTDVQSARPAGTPFLHEGKLYRPAQNCSVTYGGSMQILEIEELSPTRFSEKKIIDIQPPYRGPFRSGVHTLSAHGNVTLIDGKVDSFLPRVFLHFLKGRLAERGIRFGAPAWLQSKAVE